VRYLVAEPWFALSRADQAEALEVAAAATGRPPHLLEKTFGLFGLKNDNRMNACHSG
jgi:hypothetical protein